MNYFNDLTTNLNASFITRLAIIFFGGFLSNFDICPRYVVAVLVAVYQNRNVIDPERISVEYERTAIIDAVI